ncbi:DUF2207 domain-containing protein [Candidatus Microgenomates bacterium]|nr:DUF2207 domain-containing protein [Candidatus Microgenomates bacterium]
MKRLLSVLSIIFLFSLGGVFFSTVYAQSEDLQLEINTDTSTQRAKQLIVGGDFVIKNFTAEMLLDKDSSLVVKEKIEVDFLINKHGIFRVIPDTYKISNKTLVTPLEIMSVTDKEGKKIPFTKDHYNQSVRLKIGDPDRTITGKQLYQISYRVKRILQNYPGHLEIYWNVTGHEWDTGMEQVRAIFTSPYAKIIKTECFAGPVGSSESNCLVQETPQGVDFSPSTVINPGDDFTIVVGVDKNNQLLAPGLLDKIYFFVLDYWGYVFAFLPLVFSLTLWWFFGRDKTYLFGNVFYKPQNTKETTVSPFNRPHLPMVYSPIDSLTPSQVGAIFDERVDMQDIVAEIIELARLKVLDIKKEETKKLLGTKTEYIFTKNNQFNHKLTAYQEKIVQGIFSTKNTVKLSELKNKFYSSLEGIRREIYNSLIKTDVFPHNPISTKALWTGVYIALGIGCFVLTSIYIERTNAFLTMPILFIGGFLGFFFAQAMGRRTAWGHSLYRQTVGLRWYLDKGKWREEIAEKNLFFEEILPLAISLGVVEKLARDMKDLGIQPPDYFTAASINTFSRDLNSFSSSATSSLSSSPSGSSSWSGGSGFSGGSSGGGGGGGGGGSW